MLFPKDDKVRIERTDDALTITWQWGNPKVWPLALGPLALALLVAALIAAGEANDSRYGPNYRDPTRVPAEWLFIGFGSALSLAFLGASINRTRLSTDKKRLLRRTFPVAWPQTAVFEVAGAQQFFLSRGASRRVAVELFFMDRNDHAVRIGGEFPSRFAASQVVHELQDYFMLEDKEIFGITSDPSHPGPRK